MHACEFTKKHCTYFNGKTVGNVNYRTEGYVNYTKGKRSICGC